MAGPGMGFGPGGSLCARSERSRLLLGARWELEVCSPVTELSPSPSSSRPAPPGQGPAPGAASQLLVSTGSGVRSGPPDRPVCAGASLTFGPNLGSARGGAACSFSQQLCASDQPFLEGHTGPGITAGKAALEDTAKFRGSSPWINDVFLPHVCLPVSPVSLRMTCCDLTAGPGRETDVQPCSLHP